MSDQTSKIVEVGSNSGAIGQSEAAQAGSVCGNLWQQPENYSLRSLRAQAEIYAITRALDEAGWNRKRAAKLLRISYRGLLYKISCHKITRTKPGAAQPINAVAALAANGFKYVGESGTPE